MPTRLTLVLLVFAFMALGMTAGSAREPVPEIAISTLADGSGVIDQALFLRDPERYLSVEKALVTRGWAMATREIRNQGITRSVMWLRFILVNDTDTARRIVVTHDLTRLSQFSTYAIAPDGTIERSDFNPMATFDDRAVAYVGPATAVDMPAGETREILVRFGNSFPIPIHINTRVWSERGFERYTVAHTAYFVFWIACLVTAALFWFLYGAFMRQLRLVVYALYMSALAAMYTVYSGVGGLLLFPSVDWLQRLGFSWAMYLLSAAALEFARRHLDIARLHPRHDLALRAGTLACIVAMFLAMPSRFPPVEALMTMVAATATMFYIVYLSWVAWHRDGLGYAGWMVIGWAGVALSMVVTITGSLVNLPFVDSSQMDFVRLTFASTVVESLLLSASLAQWLRGQESRRIAAEHAASRDSLTGLLNRRGFDDHVSRLKTAGRWPGDLWLLLVDIDRFKRINDTHSHAAGDAVLTRFGNMLRHEFRADDATARFGGEEFILLFEATSQPAATSVAERVRRRFADTPTRFEDTLIEHTFSAGLVRVADYPSADEATLIAIADKALYTAKRSGRDCVRYLAKNPGRVVDLATPAETTPGPVTAHMTAATGSNT